MNPCFGYDMEKICGYTRSKIECVVNYRLANLLKTALDVINAIFPIEA